MTGNPHSHCPAATWRCAGPPKDRSLKIATDPLGVAFLFRAQTARGFVFSSDFGAVASFCDALTIHQDNVTMETMFGYSPVDTTFFRQIDRFPAASLTQLTAQGYSQLAKDKLVLGDRYCGKTDAEKFAAFDSCLAAVTERQFSVRARGDHPVLVGAAGIPVMPWRFCSSRV